MRSILTIIFSFSAIVSLFSQNVWTDVSKSEITSLHNLNPEPLPSEYRVVNLDLQELKNWLENAPMEFTAAAKNNPLILSLPMPDGSMQNFEVAKSPIMEQGFMDKFPEIKTFSLQGVEDGTASGRMDFNAENFHAFVLSANGSFLINPAGDHYLSFFKKNKITPKDNQHKCNFDHTQDIDFADQVALRSVSSVGEELRTYRFAPSASGEFSNYHGGTVSSVVAAITTTTNRINTVYERDVAVRLVLISEIEEIVHLDAATDPFTNGNAGTMLGENQISLNNLIGFQNYDIGHVFTTGGSGLAQLQSVCGNGKARGTTGVFPPTGDFFDIDYVSHEVGHQFGGNHTFNNCGGNENSGTGFEPGSGATIMAYAGLCGSNNLQFNSDDYLHGINVQEMINFIDAGGIDCATTIATNNTPPTLEIINGGFNIPISTPFELTADATDVDGDQMTYCWEQFNGGPSVPLGVPDGNPSVPLFRSYQPTASPTRVFPQLQKVINNQLFSADEYTPDYGRSLTFNVTVRDNNAGAGGIAFDQLSFNVTNSAGPFEVTYPNSATTWNVGDWLEVSWDVANTDNNIVNCKKVNIKLSVDGGFTYPYTLLTSTTNDGNEFISVPNVLTNQARIRVEAADNIFFDISNQNFSIEPPTQPGFSCFLTPSTQDVCLPENAIIDIVTDSLLGFNGAIDYSVTSTLPSGVIANFNSNSAIASEGNTLTLDMSNYFFTDTFEVTIQAIAPDLDTASRTFSIRTIGNDFTALAMESPADGASGVGELTQFDWHSGQSAEQYFYQLAKSPTFEASTIHSEGWTTDTFFIPSSQLDISTPYYWRVRGNNECGDQDFLPTQSFHTLVFACEKYENNASQNISSSGTPTIEHKITVSSGGTISDLNVAKIKGNHNNMNHLDVSLISPTGTEVELFSNICLVTNIFDFGLDDEAGSNIPCPPSGGAFFLPQNPLTTFDGESSVGDWTLKTTVNSTAGSGGKIQQFHLEICGDVTVSPPFIVKNELMPVNPSQGRDITDEFLLVEDDDNTPAELEYTLVSLPQHGTLFYLGNELSIGENFRQSSLNGGGVTYVHNGDMNQFDGFTFTVTDGEGGFIGTPEFQIEIDPDAIVNVNELLQKDKIKVFPNPNNGDFNILFGKPILEKVRVSVFNVHGQMILEKNLDQVISNLNVQMPSVAEGIYFLKIETEGEFLVKRMVVK